MTQTMEYTGRLTITRCWCGIALAIPEDLYRWAQAEKHRAVHCPLGHEFVFTENATDRANRRAKEAEATAARLRSGIQAARDQARAAERSAIAYKGHLTRLRNRVANGVCPVAGCKRSFTNVRAHIEGQHQDWLDHHPEVLV